MYEQKHNIVNECTYKPFNHKPFKLKQNESLNSWATYIPYQNFA